MTTTTIAYSDTADAGHTYGLEFRFFVGSGDGRMHTRWFASMEDRREFEEARAAKGEALITMQFLRGSAR